MANSYNDDPELDDAGQRVMAEVLKRRGIAPEPATAPDPKAGR